MKRMLFAIAAALCTGLALLGVFLPVLPTTPFLLLAVFLYMRSSRKGVKRILRNRWLSPYIRSYLSGKGMPLPIFRRTMGLLWLSLCIAACFTYDRIWILLLLACVGIGVTLHLYRKLVP